MKADTLYVILWDIVFIICSPIFLLGWTVYRLRGGDRQFTDWVLYEARSQGKVKK